ncbi:MULTISPECIES: flagellar hook protein FlgE [unclassified Sphingomonas]|uniref:flagellar hook protein FlgE n=1 Tax=unclassified Sphingomonas TaxID=196159 RepID=UPI001F5A0A5B|nr:MULTISPECIES: flagellar hook protein FlgE [unclassified Sphingomonas]
MTFYTSLSGLQASQTEMSTISHNIANVATTGFKKSRTEFADVIASSLASDPTKQVGSGAVVKENRQQFSEGNLTTTSSSLDLTVSGDGFFAVKTNGTTPTTAYTRNGSFRVDTDDNVVDAQGSYLQVYPVDSAGNVTAAGVDGLTNLMLPETSGSAQATGSVALNVNLSSSAAAPSTAFDRTKASTYNNSTATTVYDAGGNAMTMSSYYVRDASTATDGSSTWSVYSYVGNQQLTQGGSTNPVQMTFDSTGKLTAPTAPASYDSFVPTGGTKSQTIALNLAGSTAIGSAFSVTARSQDGTSVGQLQGVTVDKSGIVTASFSNGDSKALGKVALANFTDPAGLRQVGTSYWTGTGLSGTPQLGAANEKGFGSLMSGTLEGSNVDITEELVDLISAQRNFQANAKALDTQNQISQTIFNIRN